MPPENDAKELWTAVDNYLTETLIPADPVLDAAMAANSAAELPAIDVTANQGQVSPVPRAHAGRKAHP